MQKIIGKSIIIIGLAAQASAAWCVPGADWSRLPAGAKEAGLAGGLASLAEGLQGSSLDPASLANLKGMEAQASHNQWLQGVSQDQLSLGYGFDHGVGAAISANWLDMGEITRYQSQTNGIGMAEAGTLHPNAGTVALSLGAPISSALSGGLSLKAWHQSMDGENSMAGSVSGAIGYQVSPALGVVASLLDAGSDLGPDQLPTTLRLGASWTAPSKFRVGFEAAALTGLPGSIDYSAAVQAPIGKSIVIRGGAALPYGAASPDISAGFSFALRSLSLDLAYRPTQALGSALNAGLSWSTR